MKYCPICAAVCIEPSLGLTCSSCGEGMQAGWKACTSCGSPVAAVVYCTECVMELAPNWKACHQCQTPVGTQAVVEAEDDEIKEFEETI